MAGRVGPPVEIVQPVQCCTDTSIGCANTLCYGEIDPSVVLRGGPAAGSSFAPGREESISTWLGLAAVVVLVLANGFFVAAEFALVSVRRTRVQQLAAEGKGSAKRVLDLLDHLDTYIAATQLGITMASIGLGFIGEPALAGLLEPGIERLTFIPDSWRESATHTVAFIIAYTIITALHIIFGELAPKSLALQRPESTALWVVRPLRGFQVIFRPVVSALNGIGNAVVRTIGIEPAAGHALVQSAEELKLSIDASREAGLVEQAAQDLVERAFVFTDLDVRHAMVPRTEITAVSVDANLHEVLRVASESSHTRLPVYERDSDHIVGIINVKRLLPLVYEAEGDLSRPPFDLRDFMDEAPAFPETVPAVDVLTRMREARRQMSVIIDEYGGTAGIITLEDLVENLVGEIRDEGDSEDGEEHLAPDGSRVLDGLTTLVEAKEYFDLDLGEDVDVETVGGYVFGRLGRPAEIGDEVVAPDRQRLIVEELDGLRVARVRVLPAEARTVRGDEAPTEDPAAEVTLVTGQPARAAQDQDTAGVPRQRMAG